MFHDAGLAHVDQSQCPCQPGHGTQAIRAVARLLIYAAPGCCQHWQKILSGKIERTTRSVPEITGEMRSQLPELFLNNIKQVRIEISGDEAQRFNGATQVALSRIVFAQSNKLLQGSPSCGW